MTNPMIPGLTRRDWLRRMGGGFGALGLAGVLASEAKAAVNPLAPKAPHFAPRAKRVIFLFMNGGPSHVDTFDPKPMLATRSGEAAPESVRKGRNGGGKLMPSQLQVRQVRPRRDRHQRALSQARRAGR